MLSPPRRGVPRHLASCDRCHASLEVDAPSLEEAAAKLRTLGWTEHARKGGPRKSEWSCPGCRPVPAGPTSPMMGLGTSAAAELAALVAAMERELEGFVGAARETKLREICERSARHAATDAERRFWEAFVQRPKLDA